MIDLLNLPKPYLKCFIQQGRRILIELAVTFQTYHAEHNGVCTFVVPRLQSSIEVKQMAMRMRTPEEKSPRAIT